MLNELLDKINHDASALRRAAVLAALFAAIGCMILILRPFVHRESSYTDSVAQQIQDEMENNQLVFEVGPGRRTVADFQEPILLAHGKEAKLIVHSAKLQDTVSIANEGLGGWKWTSAYQDITYHGTATYTVDLSKLNSADFTLNSELKQLTVRIPYAVLEPINIPADMIEFHSVEKGWLAKDIKLTPEENAQLTAKMANLMKAKLIDENVMDAANTDAKQVVARLFQSTVAQIDPDYRVVVVQ